MVEASHRGTETQRRIGHRGELTLAGRAQRGCGVGAEGADGKVCKTDMGQKNASELANTVGVPEADNLANASQNVAIATANATENGSRIDKRDKILSTINPNRINSTSKEKEEERVCEKIAEGSKKLRSIIVAKR